MSLKTLPIPPIPEEIDRIAHAVFPKGVTRLTGAEHTPSKRCSLQAVSAKEVRSFWCPEKAFKIPLFSLYAVKAATFSLLCRVSVCFASVNRVIPFGMRRSRYRGMPKTHFQDLAIAPALNLRRALAWLAGEPLAKTRTSRFAAFIA